MKTYPMFARRFSGQFGFLQEEVQALLSYCDVSITMEEVTAWYDSYSAGNDLSLYNPWSIIGVCNKEELKPYWVETGIVKICFWDLHQLTDLFQGAHPH
jgi:hypothetical protein